jgi:hypothetical protein
MPIEVFKHLQKTEIKLKVYFIFMNVGFSKKNKEHIIGGWTALTLSGFYRV